MSTLRERAQEWLDKYKTGDSYGGNVLSLEDLATIISEYLHESAEETQVDSQIGELKKRVQELEFQLDGAERRVLRLEGENSALRFAVRCNGVSGAEVKA